MTPEPAPVRLDALLAHRAWVRSLARRLADNAVDADDLEQDVWLAAASAKPHDGAGIRAWFAQVLRNRSAERHRLDAHRVARETIVTRPEGGRSADALVQDAEAHERIVHAVLALGEPYRETVLLRYYEGLPVRDVAARMGAPADTVRTRLRRAAEMLRGSLGGRREDWLGAVAPLLDASRPALPAAAPTVAGGVAMTLTTKAVLATIALALVAGVAIRYGGVEPPARSSEAAAAITQRQSDAGASAAAASNALSASEGVSRRRNRA